MIQSLIINCDCLDFMRTVKDKHFELAIVDPPYGINAPNMSATPCQRKNGNKRLNGGYGKLKDCVLNTSNCEWDNNIPDDEYFNELFRISENQIIWGYNYFPLPPTRCVICWDKVQPWENFSQIELAWTSFEQPARIFKFDNRTGNKIHPTQKPVALYKWLLRNYAKEGDKILDTHAGSMSSVIACLDGGFQITACELDKDYFEAGKLRVLNHIKQTDMFMKQPDVIFIDSKQPHENSLIINNRSK
jgi:site-specific DNA-methyltransferase (adenine-specific)